jgi:hypothetical protein
LNKAEIALRKGNFPLMKHIYITGISKKKRHEEGNEVLRALWGPKTRKYLELEEKLFKYFEETQNNSDAHELETARLLEIAGNKFNASRRLIDKFKKQKNVSLRRTSLCQKLPSDFTDKVTAFHCHVIRMWQEKS